MTSRNVLPTRPPRSPVTILHRLHPRARLLPAHRPDVRRIPARPDHRRPRPRPRRRSTGIASPSSRSFRERGIYPSDVLNLSVDTLAWQSPDVVAERPGRDHAGEAAAVAAQLRPARWSFVAWNEAAARLYSASARLIRRRPMRSSPLSVSSGPTRPGQPPRQMMIRRCQGHGIEDRDRLGSAGVARRARPRTTFTPTSSSR